MATPACVRSSLRGLARAAARPSCQASRAQDLTTEINSLRNCRRYASSAVPKPAAKIEPPPKEPDAADAIAELRLPRSVQALYLRPLRREAKYGIPTCDLQLRSYNVRNLEFFADFALRAAYYLNLPAFGPIPLPRITERWTVPKDNFIYKKSQENFERKTLRRLIQIKDGHPETVSIWLAFLKQHAYYGIGMKANVWEYNELDVAKSMDASLKELKTTMEPTLKQFGRGISEETAAKVVELMNSENFKAASGGIAPMMQDVPRIEKI